MPSDRPQADEIKAILAVAEKIAKRTNTRFVVDEKKRDAFIKLSAALAQSSLDDEYQGRHRSRSVEF